MQKLGDDDPGRQIQFCEFMTDRIGAQLRDRYPEKTECFWAWSQFKWRKARS